MTTAPTLVQALTQRHRSNERRDCGAVSEPLPCEWDAQSAGPPRTHARQCTKALDHDGLHGLSSWERETFTDEQVVDHAPRGPWACVTCGTTWPCDERRFLDELLAGVA